MIRFLHLADVHLNAGIASKSSLVRNKLKDALYESIIKAIHYTIENELEGVILAGDFFDDDKISFKDEHFVMSQFTKLLNRGQKIFYVTGNHDPMLTARFLEPLTKQANFFLIEDDVIKCLDVVSREGEPYKVVGVGHKSKNEQRNLIQEFPRKSTDAIWLGIAHASVPSAIDIADKTRYMATPLTHIEALDYDYFALGHIHIRQLLTPKIGYSGNIQGLNIKETGQKGGYLVTLMPNMTQVEPIDFNSVQWAQYDFLITDEIESLSVLQEKLVDAVTNFISNIPTASKQIILRLNLKGKTVLKNQLEMESNRLFMSEIIKDKLGLLDLEIKSRNLTSHFDLQALSEEHTVLSDMIGRLSHLEKEEPLLKKIIDLPIFDSGMTQTEKIAYIEAMKAHLFQEVFERMVVNPNENK